MHQEPILSKLSYPWFAGWITNIHQIMWVKTPITDCSVIWTCIITGIFEPLFQDLQMLTNWCSKRITIIYGWVKVISGCQVHFSTIHQITRAKPCGGVRGAIVCHHKLVYYFIPSHTCIINIMWYVVMKVLCSLCFILLWGRSPLVYIPPTFKSLQVSVNRSDKNYLPLMLTTNISIPCLTIILDT